MSQLSHFCLYRPGKRCSVGLFSGDVSRNTSGSIADLLIVSAFRRDYSKTRTSVIGALASAGLDISRQRLKADFISTDCWLSPALPPNTAKSVGAGRVLCYEGGHYNPVESLQMMFAALLQAHADKKVQLRTLVTPILCAGDQNADPHQMLHELLHAVTVSFEAGLPIEDIRVVALPGKAAKYSGTFVAFGSNYDPFESAKDPEPEHDIFISYCHADKPFVEKVHRQIEAKFGRNVRIFRDEAGGLNPGDIIPDKLAYAIRASRCMTAFYSGKYVRSGACTMEFSLGYLRAKRLPQQFKLRPILIGAADEITGDFTNVMWEDASENPERASNVVEKIASGLMRSRAQQLGSS
jgi:hypothetical protein